MVRRKSKVEGVNELPELEAGFTEIKSLFKAGALPREADYVKLIEYVHYLHKLLGNEGAEGSPGPGLGGGLIKNDDSVLSVDGSVLAGGGLSYSGSVIGVGAGAGITVETNTITLDALNVAGNGLTGAGAVINVGAGAGIKVDSDKVSLAENSWEYIFAKLYGATHWVRNELVVVYFTRVTETSVVARGVSRAYGVFGVTMSDFSWDGYKPQADFSSLDRGCFTFMFQDAGSISGSFTVILGIVPITYTIAEIDF